MTSEEHNRYISYAFIAYGVFQLLMAGLIAVMVWLMTSFDDGPAPPPEFFFIIFGFMFFFQALFAAPSFVASYAMLKKKSWARIAGIVAAALSAMNVPVGTLAAVYSLWYFCGDQWRSVYPESNSASSPPPRQLESQPFTKWEGYSHDEEGAYVYRTPPPPDWR